MDAYPNTVASLSSTGYDFERNYGINPKTGKPNFNAKPEIINKIVDFMLQMKELYGVSLGTCAEGLTRPGISKEGCLSVESVNRMLGTSIPDKGTENNNQRQLCSCYGGKIDALKYNAACASHCVYCYAKHENDKALQYYNEDGTLKRTVYTETTYNSIKDQSVNLWYPYHKGKLNITSRPIHELGKRTFTEDVKIFSDGTSETKIVTLPVYDTLTKDDKTTFKSVEGAYQAAKLAYVDIHSVKTKRLGSTSPYWTFNPSYSGSARTQLTNLGEDIIEKLRNASKDEAIQIGSSITGLNEELWNKDKDTIRQILEQLYKLQHEDLNNSDKLSIQISEEDLKQAQEFKKRCTGGK